MIAANYFNTTTDEFINSSKLLYVYFMKIFRIFNFFFEVRSVYFNVFAEKSLQSATKTPEELGYSRRFLEEVIGSWEGEPIERPEQLYFEKREEIQSPIS